MRDGTEITLTDETEAVAFLQVKVLLACEDEPLILSLMDPPTLNALEGA